METLKTETDIEMLIATRRLEKNVLQRTPAFGTANDKDKLTNSANARTSITFCRFCGKKLTRQTTILYDAELNLIRQCFIAWCCRPQPLVISE